MPRDAFNTEVRLKFQSILLQSVDAQELDYSTLIYESQLARLHLTLRLDPLKKSAYNLDNIKRRLTEAARTWHDVLQSSARNRLSPQRVRTFLDQYSKAFPVAYREDFSPEVAITDFDYLERLQDDKSLEINLYRRRGDPEDELRIKLYYCSRLQTLSDIVLILENLGFLVLSARPYTVMPDREEDVTVRRRLEYHINDYRVRYCDYPGTHCSAEGAPLSESRMTESEDHFCQAFTAIWRGELDNDPLNRLVLAAQLSWRQVALLRAYGHYLTQIKVGFSQSYIQEALLKNIDITQRLVGLFDDLFNPAHDSNALRVGVEKMGLRRKGTVREKNSKG